LSLGHPRIEEIADVAGMSVRALQRRLTEDGLTYKRIVDEARFQVSADLFCDPHVKLIEIAHDLGYSDQANFNRAFRRWAGIPPSEYRLQLHSE
jgi:AraC-like DNA-binding protein